MGAADVAPDGAKTASAVHAATRAYRMQRRYHSVINGPTRELLTEKRADDSVSACIPLHSNAYARTVVGAVFPRPQHIDSLT